MSTVLGLDLGTHSFRAVEIDKSKKGNTLIATGEYENPNISFNGEEKDSLKDYSKAVSQFFAESSFSTSKASISLEEKDIFMRVVDLPKMSDKELKNSIMFEAEQYIPLPLDEVNVSYQKLDDSISQKGKISVQLVAAKKDVLNKYIKIIKAAKLTPLSLEPEALSVARSLSFDEDSPVASLILHLGYSKSLIVISFKGNVVFTRTLAIGGDTFTKTIAQSLGLDYMQAEEYKKAYGLDKSQAEGKIHEALLPLFNNILSEVKRAQVFFTSRHANVNINNVILSGGTALMPGLLLYIADNMDMEVELANPFAGLSFSKQLQSKKQWYLDHGPLYTVAIGLCLKKV